MDWGSIWKPLKGIASLASLIPGPQQPFILGASAAMHGIDAGRDVKNKRWGSALLNTLGAVPGIKKIPGMDRFPALRSTPLLNDAGEVVGSAPGLLSRLPAGSRLSSLAGDASRQYSRIPRFAREIGETAALGLLRSSSRPGMSPLYTGSGRFASGPTQPRLRSLYGHEFEEGGWVSPQSNGEGVLTTLGDTPSGEEIVIPADKLLAYMQNGGVKSTPPGTGFRLPDRRLAEAYRNKREEPVLSSLERLIKWLQADVDDQLTDEDMRRMYPGMYGQTYGALGKTLDEYKQMYSPDSLAVPRFHRGGGVLGLGGDLWRREVDPYDPYGLYAAANLRDDPYGLYAAANLRDSPVLEEESVTPTWWDKYGGYIGYGGLAASALLEGLTRKKPEDFGREYVEAVRPDRGLAPRLAGGAFIESRDPLLAMVAEAGNRKGPLLGAEYVGSPREVARDLGLSRQEIPVVLRQEPVTLEELVPRFEEGVDYTISNSNAPGVPGTGANPDFIDPDKQAVRDLGYGEEKRQDYGSQGESAYGADTYFNWKDQGYGGTDWYNYRPDPHGRPWATNRPEYGGQTVFRGRSDVPGPSRPDPVSDATDLNTDTTDAIKNNIRDKYSLRQMVQDVHEARGPQGLADPSVTQMTNRLGMDYWQAVNQDRRQDYLADLSGWQAQAANDFAWGGLGQSAAASRGPSIWQTGAGLFADYLEGRRQRGYLESLLNSNRRGG